MLSSETKRKINNARDILVWTVPVPSEQINLITIALIYKFMSDIDLQNKEFWAEGFFVDEYEKYSRSNIMDRKIGAHDRLYLYSEWLDKMGTNPHLPQMFRDIFRNAFLPFKDPRILDMFLKQINEFSYDHSEELGNAFEYLLSTMASQWDSWMFRTPRHIIDFIIKVVEPKFTDTILDPACGSAWFLISAYKYILESNTEKKVWDKLSLAQKTELTKNFVGYDISHEMVRLSLVNMYLHNFWDPKIFEYDTLTSESRRDDRFDCILANPPFMTPKWGIQPHNKFSVKANRSEVLFVDYIMDHLNPQWKAWIVVPEGIIFQSANAYKALRKKMIEENYLRAVVSLPSGVFQPYSWVKTSILLFDKELAKKSDDILFVKVNNDGFDLWAQRRATPDKDDLPKVLETIKNIKAKIYNEEALDSIDPNILSVPKTQIIENGDYNLSVERYRVAELMNSNYPMVELGEILDYEQPTKYIVESVDYLDEYKTPVLTAWKTFILWYTNEETWIFPADKLPVIIFDDFTTATKLVNFQFKVKSSAMKILHAKKDIANIKYIYHMMQNINFPFTEHKRYWISQYSKIQIPLPPLEVQEQIVAELDGYQKIIDWAKQIVENYKPTIKIDPEWEMVELGEIFKEIKNWKNVKQFDEKGKYKVSRIQTIAEWVVNLEKTKHTNDEVDVNDFLQEWDILFSHINSFDHLAKTAIVWSYSEKIIHWINLLRLRSNKEKILPKFALAIFKSNFFIEEARKYAQKAVNQASINTTAIKSLKIPLPPLAVQEQIVAQIEKEQAMVDSAKGLIEVFEGKMKEKIGEVWGEENNETKD